MDINLHCIKMRVLRIFSVIIEDFLYLKILYVHRILSNLYHNNRIPSISTDVVQVLRSVGLNLTSSPLPTLPYSSLPLQIEILYAVENKR